MEKSQNKGQEKINIPQVCKIVEKGVVSDVSQQDWDAIRTCFSRLQSSKFAHKFSVESRNYK